MLFVPEAAHCIRLALPAEVPQCIGNPSSPAVVLEQVDVLEAAALVAKPSGLALDEHLVGTDMLLTYAVALVVLQRGRAAGRIGGGHSRSARAFMPGQVQVYDYYCLQPVHLVTRLHTWLHCELRCGRKSKAADYAIMVAMHSCQTCTSRCFMKASGSYPPV